MQQFDSAAIFLHLLENHDMPSVLTNAQEVFYKQHHQLSRKLSKEEKKLIKLGESLYDYSITPIKGSFPVSYLSFLSFISHEMCIPDFFWLGHEHNIAKTTLRQRSASFNLDSLYGADQNAKAYLYDRNNSTKFALKKEQPFLAEPANEYPSQLLHFTHSLMSFHNQVVDFLSTHRINDEKIFSMAQCWVRWHFQWLIVNDLLPKLVNKNILQQTLDNGNRFFKRTPFAIPTAFGLAAFCISGCMTPFSHLAFEIFDDYQHRIASPISTNLTANGKSYAEQILLFGKKMDLMSGQQMARRMGVRVLLEEELIANTKLDTQKILEADDGQFLYKTPLWFYILKEAEVIEKGERLGPLGSIIVAETIVGNLLHNTPESCLHFPDWRPFLGSNLDKFNLNDLLNI